MRARAAASAALLALASAPAARPLQAQDLYEIQVYGSELVPAGRTMAELHSNYTASGVPAEGPVLSDRRAWHETLELTRGFNGWLETGLYLFSSVQADGTAAFAGWHLRPRVRAPESWGWPVGVSLSTEFGRLGPSFSSDPWTWELRPIVDWRKGRWYLAVNPALELSLQGDNKGRGWTFAPAAKIAYDATRAVAVGLEYYGSLGPLSGFDPAPLQEHQLFPALDLNLSPDWEVNAGAGFGLTRAGDRFLAKLILGYRFRG